MDVYDNLKKFDIVLPEPSQPLGLYLPVNEFGCKFIYTSGIGSVKDGKVITGKINDLTLEHGKVAARQCILNMLSALQKQVGDLNKVKKVVKLLGFVASKDDFTNQPAVINVASELLIQVFGKDGEHARSAIGVNVLPSDMSVEIEAIFELKS